MCFALIVSTPADGRRTVGVEEELMLFTAEGARPAPAGEALARDPDTDVEHEFKLEQAEIASSPTGDLDALAADLRRRRAELIGSAAGRGVLVAAVGSSPVPGRPTPTPNERYRRMHERFGLIAGDQLTSGSHVHVAVGSRAEGVTAIDGVRPWVAILLALSANSPFWAGGDSGYASYRSISWGRWPTAGPTVRFGDEATYDRIVAELVEAGAAVDDGMIYFDVRLSAKYPTVEFRIADVGQEVADSVLLAALCRALVDTAVSSPAVDPPLALLRAAAWRAARYGLSGDLLDLADARLRPAADVLDRLMDVLTPALRRSGDEALVRDGVARVLARGTGAELQRADQARRGRASDVVRAAAARTASGD
jgi:glutamate---cysteine ligase / carboxylate-amine ligase